MEAGQQLFEARQRRGLTVDDVSRTTKIPVSLLKAIERNDAARLPQGFFTRAFVRAFAAEVGLNPEQILDRFDHAQNEEVPAPLPRGYVPVHEPASSKSFFFVVALCAACAMFSSGYVSRATAPATSQVAVSTEQSTDRVEEAAFAVPPCEAPAPVATAIQSARRADLAPVERTSEPVPTPVPVTHVVADAPIETSLSPVDSSPVLTDAVLPQPETPSAAPVEQF